jgi:purine-nucleoside phosphorylase
MTMIDAAPPIRPILRPMPYFKAHPFATGGLCYFNSMSNAFEQFQNCVCRSEPRTAVVLGSGLGIIGERIRELAAVSFVDVPRLSATTVGGHAGRLVLGEWNGVPVLVYIGRVHYYEGHAWNVVTAPIRLAADLGAKRLVLTNAAGGIHPSLAPGSLMALRGHLAMLDRDVWKQPRIADCYSPALVAQLQNAGLFAGTYAALTGPSYETPAEIRALAAMGADSVGMSTAREAEAAVSLGLEVAAISCITNRAAGLGDGALDHAEVLINAKRAADRLGELIGILV